MRAREEFKGKVNIPKINAGVNEVPGIDYSQTIDFVPPKKVPSKPGELICQACGKPIRTNDFSKDPKRRAYQYKNLLHDACDEAIGATLDLSTGMDPDRHRKAAQEEIKRREAKRLPDSNTFGLSF